MTPNNLFLHVVNNVKRTWFFCGVGKGSVHVLALLFYMYLWGYGLFCGVMIFWMRASYNCFFNLYIIYHYTNKAMSDHVSSYRCSNFRLKMSPNATVPTKMTCFQCIFIYQFFLRFFIFNVAFSSIIIFPFLPKNITISTFIVFVFLRLLQTFSNVDSTLSFHIFRLHYHFAFLLHPCCLVSCFFSLPWEKNMEDNVLVLLFYAMEDKWKLLMSPLLLMLLLISPLASFHRTYIHA